MKSSLRSDEICFADEIKSVLISRRSRISSRSDFIHRRWIYSGQRTDLVEKKPLLSGRQRRFLFLSKDYKKDIFSILADGVELLHKRLSLLYITFNFMAADKNYLYFLF